ncbi:MAG: two-component regulator propeller domain-containing protein [Crocinitomicaceae bacterium]
MQKLIFALIFLTISVFTYGQHYHFKNYSLSEGLSRSGVYFILQDNEGFIWVGTEGGGISKFDGQKFTNFSSKQGLKSEHIRVIFEDDNGVLWFGTDNGLSFFEYGEIKSLTTENGLSDNYIRCITQDSEGNLWVGTNKGISIIDPSEKEISSKLKVNFNLPHKKVRTVLADSNKVWIGTDDGLCLMENNNLTIFKNTNGLSDNLILSLFMDSKDHLWIGTNKGLSVLTNGKFRSWTEADGLINNRIRSISEDIKGNIWFGTKNGISIFSDGDFINIDRSNGLSNERVRCIQKDNFGNMWIGTYFGGIMKYNYRDFISYNTNNKLPSNQILSIAENKKNELIIGTIDGASTLLYNHNAFQSDPKIFTNANLLGQPVHTIFKDSNQVLFYGIQNGLLIDAGNELISITTDNGLVGNHVSSILQKDGVYYVGTGLGLNEIKFKTNDYNNYSITTLTEEDGLAGQQISFIKEDPSQKLWIGFNDGQISILDHEKIINPKINKDINQFSSIEFDKYGNTWLGTKGKGLYYGYFDHKKNTLQIVQLPIELGLSSNYIFSLLIYDNKLWVGHEKGLDVCNLEKDSSVISVLNYGIENGFLGLQNNANASYVDSYGNLWFGTVNGLFCLNKAAEELSKSGGESINYIQSISINNHFTNWAESEYCQGIEGQFNLPVDLELPYDINTISFDFIGLNFVAPKNIKYTWRLKGFDADFRPLVSQSNCDYTNLAPGHYTFQLKSTNENGEVIDKIEEFTFTIKKPYWQTWLFRIITFLVILAILIWYLDFRTKQLISKQKKLEETITIRTQEVVDQKDELELKKSEIEFQHAELTTKSKEITDSILYSRRIQRSLLPSFEKMKAAFEHYFVLYMPKDIVSGDFYWVAEPVKSKNKKVYFAVADCTGHGVPGAMVSLICTRALNSSILEHKLRKPKDILEKTNTIVLEAFTDQETGKIIKDGMDIALGFLEYSIERMSALFSFSGAHNSAWIVLPIGTPPLIVDGKEAESNIETDTHQLYILSGTKQPIGDFDKRVPFPQQTCELPKGALIYLNTDGYADQFGGSTDEAIAAGGKKFKYKPLKKLILSIQDQPLSQQKIILADKFNDWRQNLEQVDDVCLMCIEV